MDSHDEDDYRLENSKAKRSRRDARSSAKRRRKNYSDESDDYYSENEDVEIDNEDEEEDNADPDSEKEDEAILDKYGPDGYGDEEDRMRLEALPELEREQILNERLEQRQMVLDRIEVKKHLKAGHETRKSNRSKEKPSKKGLPELMRRREEKSQKEARKSLGQESRRRLSPAYRDESDSEESSDAERRYANLEELNSIRIPRDRLEEWVYLPFFNKTVIGCFVRVLLGESKEKQGGVYRIAQIIDVKEGGRKYMIGKTCTDKHLVLKHGKAEKLFNMSIISNQNFTEREYNRLRWQCQEDRIKPTTVEHVERKRKDLEKAFNYVRTDEDIAEIIKQKERLGVVGKNLVFEKTELIRQRDLALAQGDMEKAREYQERIEHLKNIVAEKKVGSGGAEDVYAKLNARNRKANAVEIRMAEENFKREMKERIKTVVGEESKQAGSSPDILHVSKSPAIGSPAPSAANFLPSGFYKFKSTVPKLTDAVKALGLSKPLTRYESIIAETELNVDLNDL
ncbi:uncharacterized protein VTP21DRAFT_11484 [Calcarisporiella thermophila]|uniref:uncharacterized protein n=1 Tax=Calcarisporiella thermophila TaxID=911321 RepID=UPI00374469BB